MKPHDSWAAARRAIGSTIKHAVFFAALGAGPARAENPIDYSTYATGLIPAPPEVYQSFPETPGYRAFLPEAADLSPLFPAVGDQGSQGSCTGWAVGYAARTYYARATEARNLSSPANIVSPAYLYDMARQTTDCGRGAQIAKLLDTLSAGALSEQDYPYDQTLCRVPTRAQAAEAAEAADFRIKDWYRVNFANLDQIKGEIAQGNPVVFSLALYGEFFGLRGNAIYASHSGDISGYHALTAVGYDERRAAIKFINSWGAGWGDHGFGWISYDLFRDDAREAYVMRVPGTTPKPVPDPVPPRPGPLDDPDPAPLPNPPPIACGSLAKSADGSALIGYAGGEGDIDLARDYAKANGLIVKVEERPWPQCEVLATLNEALGRNGGPVLPGDHQRDFAGGDPMMFDLQLPDRSSYLHMAYIQADGSVVNLVQDQIAQLRQFQPGEHLFVGAGGNGLPKFRAGPPFGNEMLVVVSSTSPLFGETLPATQTEREYLTALRKAVLLHDQIASGGKSDVRAAYLAIATSEKGD